MSKCPGHFLFFNQNTTCSLYKICLLITFNFTNNSSPKTKSPTVFGFTGLSLLLLQHWLIITSPSLKSTDTISQLVNTPGQLAGNIVSTIVDAVK